MDTGETIKKILDLYKGNKYDEVFKLCNPIKKKLYDVKVLVQVFSISCIQTKKYNDAESFLQHYISGRSFDYDIYMNLGLAQLNLGKYHNAINTFEKILGECPKSFHALNNLGTCLIKANDLKGAYTALKKSISINDKFPLSHFNIGNVLEKIGNYKDAEISYKNAINLNPNYYKAINNLAVLINSKCQYEDSQEMLIDLINKAPRYYPAYLNLAGCYLDQLKYLEAKEVIDNFLKFDVNVPEALNLLGKTYSGLGEKAKAKKAFLDSIKRNPNFCKPYINLLKNFSDEIDDHIKGSIINLFRKGLGDKDLISLEFSYAHYLEKKGLYEKSFKHLENANKGNRKLKPFSIKNEQILFKNIRKKSTKFFNLFNGKVPPADKKLFFIIGMPRSGTSLVEQMLSCHSKVFAAGELDTLGNLCRPLYKKNANPTRQDINILREKYLEDIDKLNIEEEIITDKMPHNFLYVNLILEMFKDAKIIHLKRDKNATCWSNYKTNFKLLPYTNNLEDIYKMYDLYEKLMEFWSKKYPNKIFNLDYDLLTKEKLKTTKALTNYLEIDWEESILYPHMSSRIVRTASIDQVKREIYTDSSTKWLPYKPYIISKYKNILIQND